MADDEALNPGAKLIAGALAGAIAGVAAAFAMDRFQAAVTALSSSDGDEEPATSKAADRLAEATTGEKVPEADKPLAGQAVHYLLGAGLGVAYGLAAELRPQVTAGFGTAFGVGVAAALDEAAVPAVGLGETPWRTPLGTHAYTLASHLVFGAVTELVRRQVRGSLQPN